MQRNSFVFYKDWMEAIKDLPDDIRLEIYESVIVYATSGELRGLKSMAKIAFNFIKTSIDRDTEKYMSMIDRNKSNGVKGGRPPKEEPKKPTGLNGNPRKPKKPDNDNDSDNDNDNDSDSDNDNTPPTPSEGDKALAKNFQNFQLWVLKNAPNVAKMKEPFTQEEFFRLKDEFNYDLIINLLEEMHNWKDLAKKNVSANLTFRKWASKRK